jgi:hypothetical protein
MFEALPQLETPWEQHPTTATGMTVRASHCDHNDVALQVVQRSAWPGSHLEVSLDSCVKATNHPGVATWHARYLKS